jgi:hypothetical protein
MKSLSFPVCPNSDKLIADEEIYEDWDTYDDRGEVNDPNSPIWDDSDIHNTPFDDESTEEDPSGDL